MGLAKGRQVSVRPGQERLGVRVFCASLFIFSFIMIFISFLLAIFVFRHMRLLKWRPARLVLGTDPRVHGATWEEERRRDTAREGNIWGERRASAR